MKNNSIICLALSTAMMMVFLFNEKIKQNKNYGEKEKVFISGLPFDIGNKENNVAALFTMTNEGGRKENLDMMRSIFKDGSLGFKCEDYHNQPSKKIYDKIKELASKIDDEGTLLLYFNSHGGGSGKNFGMTAEGGNLKFSKVLKTISESKKVKRLIVLVDTCHAEGAINEGFQGSGKLIKNINTGMVELPTFYGSKKAPNFMSFFEEEDNKFYYGEDSKAYEELLIITSSSDEDLSMRGAFAIRLKKAFEQIKDNKDAKVKDFLKIFAGLHNNTRQQPYYKVVPQGILNEPLFKSFPAQDIKIKDPSGNEHKRSYILIPNQE